MKDLFFILLLLIKSEINLNKLKAETRSESQDNTDLYNSQDLSLGKYNKALLYSSCDTNELNNLMNEIDDYL